MLSVLRAAGLATALVLAPLTASAVTLDPSNSLSDGGTYDIFNGPYFFGATFDKNDSAGSYSFTFSNNSTSSLAMAVSIGTILQSTLQFLGGVTVFWQSGESAFIPDNRPTDAFNLSTLIAAGASDVLTLQFGDPSGARNGSANIDLTVDGTPAPVPVPASGLLLIGALGGMALLRRRKTA